MFRFLMVFTFFSACLISPRSYSFSGVAYYSANFTGWDESPADITKRAAALDGDKKEIFCAGIGGVVTRTPLELSCYGSPPITPYRCDAWGVITCNGASGGPSGRGACYDDPECPPSGFSYLTYDECKQAHGQSWRARTFNALEDAFCYN